MGESVTKAGVARGWWGNEVWDDDDEEEEDGEGEGRGDGAREDEDMDGTDKGDAGEKVGEKAKKKEQPEHKEPGRLEPVYSMAVEGDGLWALTGTQVCCSIQSIVACAGGTAR